MGSDCVVVLTPFLHLRPGVVKRQEPVCVEAFASELAIERLDERVVGWLAGPGEVQLDGMRKSHCLFQHTRGQKV